MISFSTYSKVLRSSIQTTETLVDYDRYGLDKETCVPNHGLVGYPCQHMKGEGHGDAKEGSSHVELVCKSDSLWALTILVPYCHLHRICSLM